MKGYGGVAEWSMAAVLKTVERQRSGGSNPSASAKIARSSAVGYFCGGGGMKMLRIFSFLPPPNLPSGEALSLRSERAASRSLSISDNGKQIHGIKLQSPHYQYVLFLTCSFRIFRDARKALVTFVSSYLSAFYKKQVLQHLPLPLRGCFSPKGFSDRPSRWLITVSQNTHTHQSGPSKASRQI